MFRRLAFSDDRNVGDTVPANPNNDLLQNEIDNTRQRMTNEFERGNYDFDDGILERLGDINQALSWAANPDSAASPLDHLNHNPER
jgi:hypothetical protein